MASRPTPPSVNDDREIDRHGTELVALLKRRGGGGSGGAAVRKAPKWAHDLLDFLWPSKS